MRVLHPIGLPTENYPNIVVAVDESHHILKTENYTSFGQAKKIGGRGAGGTRKEELDSPRGCVGEGDMPSPV